ncbi:MAG: DUF349 domain-containing protein [Prevotellaceae bacterium]|jgi:hypothetical protein|nr:DUF349 domain-containing protein [Prevotellaceae bacterium]
MTTIGANDDLLQTEESLTPAAETTENEVVAASEIAENQQDIEEKEAENEEVSAVVEPEETTEVEPAETVLEPVETEVESAETAPETVENTEIEPVETVLESVETEVEIAETTPENEEVFAAPTDIEEEENDDIREEKAELLAALSKEELVEKLRELVKTSDLSDKNEVDAIKQAFYKKLKAEQAELLRKFTEDGGDKDDFVAPKEAQEEALRELLQEYRTKKNEANQKILKEKESNLKTKSKILDNLKSLSENLDNLGDKFNEAIQNVRNLQQEWKSTGQVPPEKSTELWKNYQLYIEKFYDYKKISDELREYDLKKNLEVKTALCEQAEKLNEEKDVLTAFRTLQKLHEEWKEIGPVAHEFRETLWEKFKAASLVINKKHQSFFEDKKAEEEKNLAEKTALCEAIEGIDFSGFTAMKEWDKATEKVLELQAKWKKVGFAPKKVNVKIYERFRTACDKFFNTKNDFFKQVKDELNDNLKKKIHLCEQAEALKGSTEWRETSDKLIKLQKEWKTIGTVPRKHSDTVWKRFVAACDHFFEQKSKVTSNEKEEQSQNLQKKQEIIAKIESLDTAEPKKAEKTLRELIADFNEVGFVPFKEKERIYKAFKKAADAMFDKLNVDEFSRRLNNFRANIEDIAEKGQHKLFRERDKLKKDLEFLRTEISTFENNIGFFSSSKNADKLIKDMEKKIAKLKTERELIVKKIDLIENNL